MRIGLIDDDIKFVKHFKDLCLPFFERIDTEIEFVGFNKTVPYLQLEGLDLLFLDIQINDDNGISYALDLRNHIQTKIPLVFMSSKNELVFETMAAGSIYFIRKNNLKSDFNLFFKLFKKQYTKSQIIFIGQDIPIKVVDIIYISAYGHDITIQTTKKQYLIHGTMKKILSQIKTDDFVQIQKSTTISLSKVIDVDGNLILMVGGSKFEASRLYKNRFLEMYKGYLLR